MIGGRVDDATPGDLTRKWWVRLQVGLGLAGGGVWVGGKVAGSEFVAGTGLGLVIAALVLRFGRKAARE